MIRVSIVLKMVYLHSLSLAILLSISIVSFFLIQSHRHFNLSSHKLEQVITHLEKNYTTINHIDTETAAQWLQRFPNTIVLDIRETEEFGVSHLKNADNVPPKTSIAEVVSTVLKNASSEQKIIVYCSVGVRSAQFAKKLEAAGYNNVYNLKGSLFAWVNEGRPVYQQDKRVSKVHPFDKKWGQLLLPEYRHLL